LPIADCRLPLADCRLPIEEATKKRLLPSTLQGSMGIWVDS